MNAQAILGGLLRRGVELQAEDGDLRLFSPGGALTPELRAALAANKAQVLALAGDGARLLPPPAPLRRVLAQERARPGDPTHHRQSQVRFDGGFDADAFGRALRSLANRHETLRSSFPVLDGAMALAIRDGCATVPVARIPPTETVDAWLERDARMPFDLSRAPLMRAAVVEERDAHCVVLTMHQAVADAWTTTLLWNDLSGIYGALRAGRACSIEPTPMPYAAAVRAENVFAASAACRQMADWWGEELEDAPIELWPDSGLCSSRRGACLSGDLPLAALQAASALAQRCGTTLFTVLLAGFAALLHGASGCEDLSIGAPVANRAEPGSEAVAGYFSNLVVLRIHARASSSFRQLVEHVRGVTLAAWRRQRVPFDQLVAELATGRVEGRNPLFQAMFNMAEVHSSSANAPQIEFLPMRGEWNADVDLTLGVRPQRETWNIDFFYNTAALSADQVRHYIQAFGATLRAAAQDPERSVASLIAASLPALASGRDRTGVEAIEAALLAQPGVRDAAVLGRKDKHGRERLVAYLSGAAAYSAPTPRVPEDIALVPVSRIPRDRGGRAVREQLARLPTITPSVREELARQVGRSGPPARFLEARRPEPARLLHSMDLWPSWLPGAAERAAQAAADGAAAAAASTAARRAPADGAQPAIADGGPLQRNADAPRTLIEALAQAAQSSWAGQLRHVRAQGDDLPDSWAELRLDALRIAAALRPHLRRGDPVVVPLVSTRDTLRAFWAALLAGGAPAILALPAAAADGESTRFNACISMLGEPLLVTTSGAAEHVRAACSAGRLRLFLADQAAQEKPALDSELAAPREDDTALFTFTSGSTGTPKCIPLSHRNLISRALGAIQLCGLSSADVALNWLPFEHIGSISDWHLRCLLQRCQAVYVETSAILERPLRWLDYLAAYRITHSWGPNFAYALVLRALREDRRRPWDLGSVRSLLTAGESVSPAITAEFLDALAPCGLVRDAVHPAFGMSEMGSGVTYCGPRAQGGIAAHWVRRATLAGRVEFAPPGDPAAVPLAECGAPIPGVSIRIADENGAVLAAETVGRLQVRGEAVFTGYRDNAGATRAAFTHDGWFDTGDLGFISNGRLVLTGRLKDILIVNGANYACSEVEAAVESAPGVAAASAVAVSVSSATGAENAAVFFSPSDAATPLANVLKSIRAAVSRRVGVDPEYLVPLDESAIPRTSIGKIRRAALGDDLLGGKWNAAIRIADLALANARTLPDAFHEIHWQPAEAHDLREPLTHVVFPDRSPLAAHFLALPDLRATELRRDGDHRSALLQACAGDRPVSIAWFAVEEEEGANSLRDLLGLLRTLANCKPAAPIAFLVISSRSQRCAPGERVEPAQAALAALVQAACAEIPSIRFRHVDVREDDAGAAACILRETRSVGTAAEIAWRDGVRYPRGLRRVPAAGRLGPDPLRVEGVWLLLGGLGGIGGILSEWLMARYRARVILCGRTSLDENTAAAQVRGARLKTLESLGRAVYLRGSVEDPALESRIRDQLRGWNAPLDGVIDLTSAYRPLRLSEARENDIEGAIAARIAAARLAQSFAGKNTLAIAFSSIVSFLGGAGLGPYAAGCRACEAAWTNFAADAPHIRALSIAWPLWERTGIAEHIDPEVMRAAGGFSLSPEHGLNAFRAAIGLDRSQLLVGLDARHPAVAPALAARPRPLRALFALSPAKLDIAPVMDEFGVPVSCTAVQLDAWNADEDLLRTQIENELDPAASAVAPRNGVERRLAAIWEAVLGKPVHDVRASFFEMGGQSLLLMQLASRIRGEFGVELPLASLFESSTIEEMVRLLLRKKAAQRNPQTLAELTRRMRGLTRAPHGRPDAAPQPAEMEQVQ